VSMAGDRIFAQPETITGSIGVFAVVPTFEAAAARIGVTADGYRTTPLSGQPDIIAGFSPEMDAILQASIGSTYSDFLNLVSKARKLPTARVDAIGGGRVWDGGTARQLGLVDEFGGLEDALAWAAAKAGAKQGDWHPVYLGGQSDNYDSLIRQLVTSAAAPAQAAPGGDLFALAARRNGALTTRLTRDAERLLSTQGIQAFCLECPAPANPAPARKPSPGGLAALLGWLAAP